MNLQEVVARAATIAESKSGDGKLSSLIDMGEWTAETLFPHAVDYTLDKLSKSSDDKIQDLMTWTPISFTAGEATVPAGTFPEHIKFAQAEGRKFLTYLPYPDYLRFKFDHVCDYFTLHEANSKILYKQGGTASFTGALNMALVIKPELPGTITDDIPLTDRLLEDVIIALAAVMCGEMKIGDLLSD